jgi:hypothetical protein
MALDRDVAERIARIEADVDTTGMDRMGRGDGGNRFFGMAPGAFEQQFGAI